MKFEWDDAKAWENEAKHGVSFEEASTVFEDPFMQYFADDEHSVTEERYWAVGESDAGSLLVVCCTDRGETVRLISARPVTNKERQRYERGDTA